MHTPLYRSRGRVLGQGQQDPQPRCYTGGIEVSSMETSRTSRLHQCQDKERAQSQKFTTMIGEATLELLLQG